MVLVYTYVIIMFCALVLVSVSYYLSLFYCRVQVNLLPQQILKTIFKQHDYPN